MGAVTGVVCLQGGGEFSPGCAAMDRSLLSAVGGPVVVTALAAESGRDYRRATDNGVAHLRALGSHLGGHEVLAAPDARENPREATALLRDARLIVLPGGSPSRLLTALRSTGLAAVLTEHVAAGGAVLGASAGAMVLCPWTVLPDRRGPRGLGVAEGLGIVPGLVVVPHWSGGSSRADWLRALHAAVPEGVQVLGLPEESGVLVSDGVLTAVGQHPTRLVDEGLDLAVGGSRPLP